MRGLPRPGPARGVDPMLVGGALLAIAVATLALAGWGARPSSPPGSGPSLGSSGSAASAAAASSAGSSGASAAPVPSPVRSPVMSPGGVGRSGFPAFGHVFVIVMENKGFGAVIGNPAAPYINGLASRYGLATGYTAVSHPSEPNYLALWSGSTQGVTDDAVHDFSTGTTLGDQVEASGRSWHVAAQNVPLGCFRGASASGGEDGSGTYARKHEPAISWTSVSGNPARCARITDFSHFDPAAGNLWLIVPNLCNDMHDCSVATGDTFLRSWLPTILDSPAFANGVVFLTWDEGSGSNGGGGRVPLVVISPFARSGFVSATSHSHFSLLGTIEAAWGLRCLGAACGATELSEFFR